MGYYLRVLCDPRANPEDVADAAAPLGNDAAAIADDLRTIGRIRELQAAVAAGQVDGLADEVAAARAECLALPIRHREEDPKPVAA